MFIECAVHAHYVCMDHVWLKVVPIPISFLFQDVASVC